MTQNLSGVMKGSVTGIAIAAACQLGTASSAWAQQAGDQTAPAEAAAPAPTALTTPSMTGPLVANPNPLAWEVESIGTINIGGVVSGLTVLTSDPVPPDKSGRIDISNGQVFIQKADGLFQFYAQIGAYALPALGTPYISADRGVGDFFGPLPVGYVKFAPTDEFSFLVGKLPTLIGAEYTFTFENMNVERGLLWNQENAVNHGVQANYTLGPLAFSVSLNDGFYSNRYNWVSGAAAWTIDKENTLTVVGMGNVGTTAKSTLATPLLQNNSDIINLIYTYNSAPWTITPYFQFTHVDKSAKLGIGHDASTYGGAILASYAFNENVSLAGRVEYIASTGSLADGSPSLLYGPGSTAWSVTVTPTWQEGIFFFRPEISFVKADSITPGFAFGKGGGQNTQARLLLEGGVLF